MIINILSKKLKLIRTEYGFSQEKMSEVLGFSKKTLIQIEKGRNELNWTTAVALCAIFQESEVILMSLGENPVEVIRTVALKHLEPSKTKTLGGKVWWKDIKIAGGFKMQQNIVSGHYRILDCENQRWYSSFNRDYIEEKFLLLTHYKTN